MTNKSIIAYYKVWVNFECRKLLSFGSLAGWRGGNNLLDNILGSVIVKKLAEDAKGAAFGEKILPVLACNLRQSSAILMRRA